MYGGRLFPNVDRIRVLLLMKGLRGTGAVFIFRCCCCVFLLVLVLVLERFFRRQRGRFAVEVRVQPRRHNFHARASDAIKESQSQKLVLLYYGIGMEELSKKCRDS